jgi:hypothetical protein
VEASGTSRSRLTRPTLAGGEAYASDIPTPPGRGADQPPQSLFEARARLAPQVQELRRQASQLSAAQLGRARRVIIEAETMPNFLAASYHPRDLLRETGLLPVGSRPTTGTRFRRKAEDELDQPARVYLLSADESALARLDEIYAEHTEVEQSLEIDMRKFTSMRLESADRALRLGTGEAPPVIDGYFAMEAVLHPQLAAAGEPDPAAEQRVRQDFIEFIGGLDGQVDAAHARLETGMWHLPVLLPQRDGVLRDAASFVQLRVLRPMPELRQEPAVGEIRWRLEGVPGAPFADRRRIAIFDGGVHFDVAGMDQWVREISLTSEVPLAGPQDHGTAVTSAALFGPLQQSGVISAPHTPVDHFRVWPPPPDVRRDAELFWILERIEQAIANGNYRVAVITLAPQLTVEDGEPHAWTAVLDRLALDHDVLFVVAAGNNGELEAGLNRLLVPADLINGLSVGSCSELDGLALRDSYSCVGPGRPGAMTAPTGVQFGGNFDDDAFGALTSGGEVAAHEGTSLAAPTVARACAELDALLDHTASANLLRTMAVHHAERPDPRKQGKAAGSTPADVGYGRLPASFRPLLEHDPATVTIIYDGLVKRRQRISLDIPVPDDVFAASETRLFDVRWTLGFFAPVEPAHPVDYSSAGIQVYFRPHTEKYTLYNGDKQPVGTVNRLLAHDRARIAYEESRGGGQSARPVASEKTGFAPEVVQRHIHGKWESVVRMDRSLQGRSLYRPCVDFHMLVRDGGDLVREAEDLSYVLIVSVGSRAGVNVYDRTEATATLLSPLTVSVPVLVPGA